MAEVNIRSGWLFVIGTLLMSASVLMKPFPGFIFISLAPFFAIIDRISEGRRFWEYMELILLGLAISLFSATRFDTGTIITTLGQAIAFTLPFLVFSFIRNSLGQRTGKFIIIFLWLGIEYIMLKTGIPYLFYLCDALSLKGNWMKWNETTGYLGGSVWILACNWIFYTALLRKQLVWPLLILAIMLVTGPIIYSQFISGGGIPRGMMVNLYSGKDVTNEVYSKQGEIAARTGAWLSALIIIFSLVKNKVKHK